MTSLDSRKLSYLSLAASLVACVLAVVSLGSGPKDGLWSIEGAGGEVIEVDAKRGEIRALGADGNFIWRLGRREGGAALELHTPGHLPPLIVLQTRTPELTVKSAANLPFISASSSSPIGPHFGVFDASGRVIGRLAEPPDQAAPPVERTEER